MSVWTETTVFPSEALRARVRLPDGRMEDASCILFTRWSENKVTTSSSFSWLFPSGFDDEAAEAALFQLHQSKSERPLSLTAGRPLELFSVTNRFGGVLAGSVEYERAVPAPPEAGAQVQASVKIQRYAAYLPSLDYSAAVPPGYALRATANAGEVHTHRSSGSTEYHSAWFRLPAYNPAALRDWPARRQAEQSGIEAQFQRLWEKGTFKIVPGEPRLIFSITNRPGDVYQGFLELVGPVPDASL